MLENNCPIFSRPLPSSYLLVVLLEDLYLLPSPGEPRELVGVRPVLVGLEDGQVDAGHVVLPGPDLELRLVDVLQHRLAEVPAGELGLCQGEGRLLHHVPHRLLRLHDLLQDLTEAHLQGVGLLLQQAERMDKYKRCIYWYYLTKSRVN